MTAVQALRTGPDFDGRVRVSFSDSEIDLLLLQCEAPDDEAGIITATLVLSPEAARSLGGQLLEVQRTIEANRDPPQA